MRTEKFLARASDALAEGEHRRAVAGRAVAAGVVWGRAEPAGRGGGRRVLGAQGRRGGQDQECGDSTGGVAEHGKSLGKLAGPFRTRLADESCVFIGRRSGRRKVAPALRQITRPRRRLLGGHWIGPLELLADQLLEIFAALASRCIRRAEPASGRTGDWPHSGRASFGGAEYTRYPLSPSIVRSETCPACKWSSVPSTASSKSLGRSRRVKVGMDLASIFT